MRRVDVRVVSGLRSGSPKGCIRIMIKNILYRWLLPRLIANACAARIPRSGEPGEGVNCYVVALDRAGGPYFIATSMAGDLLEGVTWNGASYADSTTLSISNLATAQLNITHYYGLTEVRYDSIYEAAWHNVTRLIYLRIRIHRYVESTFQYFFNKRKLVTRRRIELLQLMMDDQLDRSHNSISSVALMAKIYSMRMFLHPSWTSQERRLRLYLDSLVATGELECINGDYVVTGLAISTIERFEEEERRHVEAVKLQRLMFYLTVVGAVFAAIQSQIIKLPTFIDWSTFKW